MALINKFHLDQINITGYRKERNNLYQCRLFFKLSPSKSLLINCETREFKAEAYCVRTFDAKNIRSNHFILVTVAMFNNFRLKLNQNDIVTVTNDTICNCNNDNLLFKLSPSKSLLINCDTLEGVLAYALCVECEECALKSFDPSHRGNHQRTSS